MEITTMRYFREVARTGNISKAAKALGITQPPLSRILRSLQNEIGTPLFRRTTHGVNLTPVGEQFYHAVENIISLTDSTISRFTGMGNHVEGSIRIACVEDILTPRLTDALNVFINLYPKIRIDFTCGEPASVRKQVSSGVVDVAISNYTYQEEHLEYIDSGIKRRLGILMPSTAKHSSIKSITIEQLQGFELIAPRKDAMEAVLGELYDKYSKYNISVTYDTPLNYLSLINNNNRFMACFDLNPEIIKNNNLVFCPIKPEIMINVGLIYRKDIQDEDPAMLLIKHIKRTMELHNRGNY